MNIQELQAQYSELEASKAALFEQGSVDQVQVSRLNEQMKAVQAQIAAIQSEVQLQQEQEQVKEEVLSTLAQQIADYDIFGALLPEEQYQEELGLTVYNERRKLLNEIVYTLASELQTSLIGTYDIKLADRDSQIRALSVDKTALEGRVNELTEQYEDAIATVKTNDDEIEMLKVALEAANASLAELEKSTSATIAQLTADNASLKDQLARKQEVAAPKPSQSMADLLASTRSNSIKTAKELALEGVSHRGKVILGPTGEALTPPTIGGSESQDSFRGEANQANAQVDTILAPEVAPVESAFRPEEENVSLGLELAEGDVHGTSTTKTVEERLKALEIAVFGAAEVAA